MIKKLISYLLPITAVGLIPLVLILLTKASVKFFIASILFGALFFVTGLAFLIWTIRIFETVGRGTLAPWSPTQQLITHGPYKHIRNPMILAVVSMILGVSLIFFNPWILLWAVFFAVLNTVYFKTSEESGLAKRFGAEYEAYRQEVPMWLPTYQKNKNKPK